jgi:hypothetical protein
MYNMIEAERHEEQLGCVVAALLTPNIWTKIIRPNSAEPNLLFGFGL